MTLYESSGVSTNMSLNYGSMQLECPLLNGGVVEGACWLHLEKDIQHINVAELDAIIRSVNVTLQWKLKKNCTYSWTLHVFLDGYQTLSLERPKYMQMPQRQCSFRGGSALWKN